MDRTTYRRRFLLAVTGLSPQVVTETLFALAVDCDPPFVPTEIHLLTTAEGAERARLSLLSPEPGWFARILSDYDLPPIDFGPANIHVLSDTAGRELDDIRTLADNQTAADITTEWVRTLTANPNCALHVSIAGGRKTMGYYLGYALSLFGRPQDRLSHVLVPEPFESSWDFFYPTPYSRVITTRDNKLADTAEAKVTLAQIPFVRLRDGLPDRLLAGNASFGQTVTAAQSALEPPELVIDLAGQRIRAGGEVVSLPSASLAFYSTMARRRLKGMHAARWDTEGLDQQFLGEYRRIIGDMSGDYERVEEALAEGMTAEYFDQRKSRTNAALEQALGHQLAAPYLVHGEGRRPRTRFSLRIDPDAIHYSPITDERLTCQPSVETATPGNAAYAASQGTGE
ncbi:MAG: CRISPR-associated ring nuclease Csm6 [Pseudomonadota bacterium]|nr:CRISPR-associated ring nuclease Csm6 [Pseudomonadota bacterium]